MACSSIVSGSMFKSSQDLSASPLTPLTLANPLARWVSHPAGTPSSIGLISAPTSSMYFLVTSSGLIVGHQSALFKTVEIAMATDFGSIGAE